MKKALVTAIGILIIAAASVFFVVPIFFPHAQVSAPTHEAAAPERSQPVTIDFVGDIMMDRGVRASVVKNFDGDYHALYANAGYLAAADIAFANLEGPVGTSGHDVGSRFSFEMDPAGLAAMRDAGFDVVSFANNHVGDYTRDAFTETLGHLQENGILPAGAGLNLPQASMPSIITVRGIRIGFLAATDVGPTWLQATTASAGVLIASDPMLPTIIANAKKQVDVLVMAFHWGVEYSPANARQEALAHMAIDNGADIVYGAHPHVMQKTEIYNGKPIFYSLGNFIFDQYFSPHTMQGMIGEVSIDPTTHAITATETVSPMSAQFVPQTPISFDPSMLITKPFTP